MKVMLISSKENEIEFYNNVIKSNFEDIDEICLAKNKAFVKEIMKKKFIDIVIIINNYSFEESIYIQKHILGISKDVYTILVSDYYSFEYARFAMQNKIRDFLIKPASEDDILDAIKKAIEILVDFESDLCYDKNYSDLMNKALKFIKENYNTKLTLEKVANYIHLNPQYFSRVFKDEVKISFNEYLNILKIEKSLELLVNTNYPAYKIAQEIGFNDASYFNKIFVEIMGVTPCKYRKKIKLSKK